MNTKEIFEKITLFYKTKNISELVQLKSFNDYLLNIDSQNKHTAGIYLYDYYDDYAAIAIAYSAISCLVNNNIDIETILYSLSIGDTIIVEGKRSEFGGIVEGNKLGKDFSAPLYCIYKNKDGTFYVPLDKMKNKSVSVYNGEAASLDGKGVRSDYKERKKFLTFIGKEENISTELHHSVAIVIDREQAEDYYNNLVIAYGDRRVHLSDLVTATYYSDNDCYQIGTNPNKEEPTLKFYSKLSACREDIISDKQKRIIGCFLVDEDVWATDSETHSIVDRKSIKFAIMLGKFHFTLYREWIDSDEYKIHIPDEEFFNSRKINYNLIESGTSSDVMIDLKRKLLNLRNTNNLSDERNAYFMEAHSLLNLCRSSFFPLSYFDKVVDTGRLYDRLKSLTLLCNSFIGTDINMASEICSKIRKMVEDLYNVNPKGKALEELLATTKIDAIVVTKAYYDKILNLWLKDVGMGTVPDVLTVSAFSRGGIVYDNVLFPTLYYDFDFNPLAEVKFKNATILYYPYEQLKLRLHKREINSAKLKLSERFGIKTETKIEDEEEIEPAEVTYETSLDTLSKELQLKRAYQYARSDFSAVTDSTVPIQKVFTFASGEVGYITKQYKAYRLANNSIEEVDADNLHIGDSIVFTKQTENKDIVDVLLQQILAKESSGSKVVSDYENSIMWKNQLRAFMERMEISYQEVADRLIFLGCKKEQVTIRQWLMPDSRIVGPRSVTDYEAILKLLKINTITADKLCESCSNIRSLRTKILSYLAKAILKKITKQDGDEMWSVVETKADSLAQIEQITSINEATVGMRMPMHLINKPCTL
jgi:hypothetical protein